MIASGQSGWAPNPAHSCVSDSILGDWKEPGDPCHGPKANTTYDSQSTHVIHVQGKKDAYISMADRWNPANLRDSICLAPRPLRWRPTEVRLERLLVAKGFVNGPPLPTQTS